MSLLFRYIFKNHFRLVCMTLAVGLGIFILTDLVENADAFFAVDNSIKLIVQFYFARIPSIISQILPAVFLLASVILLCMMISSRENTALSAGGISVYIMAKMLFLCGVFWAILQFMFSQVFAVTGDAYAERLWDEKVRSRVITEEIITNVWFIDNNYMISLDTVKESGYGENLVAYELAENGKEIRTIVRAEKFHAEPYNWILTDVTISNLDDYSEITKDIYTLAIEQSVDFFFIGEQSKPQTLSFFVLGEAIDRLEHTGSNVGALSTVWHSKLAYACSLVVMAFIAMAIVSCRENVYVAVAISIVITFVAYVLTMFGDSLGQQGVVPPFVGAWGPQILLFLVASGRLQYISNRS